MISDRGLTRRHRCQKLPACLAAERFRTRSTERTPDGPERLKPPAARAGGNPDAPLQPDQTQRWHDLRLPCLL